MFVRFLRGTFYRFSLTGEVGACLLLMWRDSYFLGTRLAQVSVMVHRLTGLFSMRKIDKCLVS